MGISIDRLAMEIAGKRIVTARLILDRFGFSLAEASEIIFSHCRTEADSIDPDWQAVAVTIKSTMQVSVAIKDRVDMSIG